MKTVIDKSGKPFEAIYTVENTALILNKSVPTIYRWVREGYMEADSQIEPLFSRMAFSVTAIDQCAKKLGIWL